MAAELRSATDRAAAGFADPPADAETFAFTGPAALATFPAAADAEDPVAAKALLSQALAVSFPGLLQPSGRKYSTTPCYYRAKLELYRVCQAVGLYIRL